MFAKIDNGSLLIAVKAVQSSDYQLLAENYQDYQYPVAGWYWFETETDAMDFFGLQKHKGQIFQNNQI